MIKRERSGDDDDNFLPSSSAAGRNPKKQKGQARRPCNLLYHRGSIAYCPCL